MSDLYFPFHLTSINYLQFEFVLKFVFVRLSVYACTLKLIHKLFNCLGMSDYPVCVIMDACIYANPCILSLFCLSFLVMAYCLSY